MSTVKNQHYVPQFYLRNFSLNKKQLYVFDKTNLREFISSIDSVASSKFYYDWKDLDGIVGEQFIENKLSILEGTASVKLNELISRIENNSFKGFEKEEKLIISEFIWYQMIRTPEARVQGNYFTRVLEQELRSKGFSDEIIRQNGLNSENFDERKEHLLRIISPSHIKESIESLSERMWIVAKNETNYTFYTSDNPIVRHIHYERGASAYEIFFPLTPAIGLILLNKEDFIDLSMFNNKIMILNKKEFVKWYNEQQIYFAGRQIFNIENDFRFARRVIKLAK